MSETLISKCKQHFCANFSKKRMKVTATVAIIDSFRDECIGNQWRSTASHFSWFAWLWFIQNCQAKNVVNAQRVKGKLDYLHMYPTSEILSLILKKSERVDRWNDRVYSVYIECIRNRKDCESVRIERKSKHALNIFNLRKKSLNRRWRKL